MKAREGFELPPDKEEKNQRATRLEWWTIVSMIVVTVVMYLVMGNSQAMKAAWVEDLLSLVPPIAFLVASRYRNRDPNEQFPYGRHRSISIAFLCAAVALTAMGLYIVYDSTSKLVKMEHPSIGLMEWYGRQFWMGWMMIAVLTASAIPPVLLGRMKLPLAKELHDKALHADADMNKADWLTALAGVAGVAGIGVGWWWADAVAALFISIEVTRDGLKNLKRVIADLMDRRPMTVDGEVSESPQRLRERIRSLDWVADADVRLREEGHVFAGEVYVVPKSVTPDLLERIEEIPDIANETDWRIHEVVVMPVKSLD
jgi:cation diffusion facilitator family transporter